MSPWRVRVPHIDTYYVIAFLTDILESPNAVSIVTFGLTTMLREGPIKMLAHMGNDRVFEE